MRYLIFLFTLFVTSGLWAQEKSFAISSYIHGSQASISEEEPNSSRRSDHPGHLQDMVYGLSFRYNPNQKWIFFGGLATGRRDAEMDIIIREREPGNLLGGVSGFLIGVTTNNPALALTSLLTPGGGGYNSDRYTLLYSGRLWEGAVGAERFLFGSWSDRVSGSVSATLRRTKLSRIEITSNGVWNEYKLQEELSAARTRLDLGGLFYIRPISKGPVLFTCSIYAAAAEKSPESIYKSSTRVGYRLGLSVEL
jgi:hypothetical protein